MSNNTLKEESTVMQHNSDAEYWKKRALDAETELKAKEDTRTFDVIVERIDGTDKYLLVIPSINFSAQMIRRDKNTLI